MDDLTRLQKQVRGQRLALYAIASVMMAAFTMGAAYTHQLLLDGAGQPASIVSFTSPNWTGTLDASRLPPTVPLYDGSGNLTLGNNLTVTNNATAAAFIGDGSALTNLGPSHLSGTVSVANGGTGASMLTGLLKGNGTSPFTAAVAGTDYLAPSGDGSALTGILLGANNLSDVASTGISLSNLGGAPLANPIFTGIVNIPSGANITGYAKLASPTFTGTVTASLFSGSGASLTNVAPYHSVSVPASVAYGPTVHSSTVTANVTDVAGNISLTTSGSGTGGVFATITFGTAYGSTPHAFLLTGYEINSSGDVVPLYFTTSVTALGVTINAPAGTDNASQYKLQYAVVQ